jgi:hypothetical protein
MLAFVAARIFHHHGLVDARAVGELAQERAGAVILGDDLVAVVDKLRGELIKVILVVISLI